MSGPLALPSAWASRQKSSRVHVVTVCTRSEGCTTALLYSDAILDTHLTLLGWGETCGGPGWRLKKVVDFCKEVELQDVVVVVDGFNTVILQPREVILDKFLEFGGRIVCMGQQDANYRQTRQSLHAPQLQRAAGQSRPAFLTVLNAGAFAAFARDIINLFADVPEDLSQHVLLGEMYNAQPDVLVTVDSNGSLFHRYRSANDLAVLSYADAHAQSTHVPPNLPSTRGPILPCSLGAPHSPPFFRPSPLPRIAMDVVTRETPCFVHIPRSHNADNFLKQLGLPAQGAQLGSMSLIPRLCREFIHKYRRAVLPPTAHLDRLVSWLFITFFVSAEILGILSLMGILKVALALIPDDTPQEPAGSFFLWRQGPQQKALPRHWHRIAESAIFTSVSATCKGLHHLFHFCHALSWVWLLALVMSGLGLTAVAVWSSLLRRRPATVSGGQYPRFNSRLRTGIRPKVEGACTREETAEEYGSAVGFALHTEVAASVQSPKTTFLQHMIQEQASLARMRQDSALLESCTAERHTFPIQGVGGAMKPRRGARGNPGGNTIALLQFTGGGVDDAEAP